MSTRHENQKQLNKTLSPQEAYIYSKVTSKRLKSDIQGLWVNILRSKQSVGLNIISNIHEKVLLVGNDIPRLSELERGAPVFILKNLFNKSLISVPENLSLMNPSFSGNFIWLNHKRFPSMHPIPIWDLVGSKKILQAG